MSGIPSLVLLVPACAADIGYRSTVDRDALFHVCGSILWARDGEIRRLSPVMGRLVVALYGAHGWTLTYRDAFDAVFADDPDGGGAFDLVHSMAQRRRDSRPRLDALGIKIETRPFLGYQMQIEPVRERRAPPLRVVASTRSRMIVSRAATLHVGAAA